MPLPNIKNIVWTAVQSAGVQWVSALTDWMKRASITINGAKKTATYSDNLTSNTNWTGLSGAFSYDATDDEIDYNCDTSLSTAYWNLGSALNSDKWVVRTKLDIDTFSATSANIQQLNITVSDGTGDRSATQDSIGFLVRIDSLGSKFQTQWGNNQNLASNTSDFTETPATGTYYIEIKRTSSSTFTVTLYSDSDYSEVIDTKNITGVTATSLQYVKLATYSEATTNDLVGSIDDIEVYDGETVVENIPSQQTAVLDDDFTSYDESSADSTYPSTDETKLDVNLTNNNIDFDCPTSATDDTLVRDIGTANISDDRWLMRCKVDLTTVDNNTISDGQSIFIGLTADNNTPNGTVTDFLGINFKDDTTIDNKIRIGHGNGVKVNNSTWTNFSRTLAVETLYIEMIRESTTSFKINLFSDSGYSTLLESQSVTISSSYTGLRYFYVGSLTGGTANGRITGTIDDLQFWNNITEVNPSTLTDYPIPIKITGNTDLQRKTTETHEDLFTTDNYSHSGGTNDVDTTNNYLTWEGDRDGTLHASADPITAVSDTKWTMMFDVDIDQIDNPTTASHKWLFGLSDSDHTTGGADNQDFLGIQIQADSGGDSIKVMSADGTAPNATVEYTFTHTPTVREYYFTMIRLSSTQLIVYLYADKARTIEIENSGVVTISSGTISLDNVKGMNNNLSSASGGGLNGKVRNVRIWDNTTNPVNQETATHTDDMTSYADQTAFDNAWVSSDTGKTRGNPTDDDIDFQLEASSGDNNGIVYDLQSVLNGNLDDEFVLDFRVNWSSITDNNSNEFLFGISNIGTSNSQTSQNAIGGSVNLFVTNSVSVLKANNAGLDPSRSDTQTYDIITSTNYYFRVVKSKQGVFCRMYSDSDRTILLTESTTTDISFSDLRYIFFTNWSGGTGGVSTGIIDDIALWNGISSPNASARKFVFTDNVTDDTATQYSSETVSYDPINGDYYGYVRIPSLTTGADTTIQMYYDYQATNPDYSIALDKLFETDFTTDEFTDFGSGLISVDSSTNERLDFDVDGDNQPEDLGSQVDLGVLDNNAWCIDFTYHMTTLAIRTSGSGCILYIAVADTDHSGANDDSTLQDAVGIYTKQSNTNDGQDAFVTDGTSYPTADGTIFDKTAGTTHYMRLQRDGDDFIATWYSDSARTSVTATKTISIGNATGFRYFIIRNHAGLGSTPNCRIQGYIDDLVVYNGSTLPITKEESTWDSNHKAVYHLSGNSIDSTVYGNDGTESGVTNASGVSIGASKGFDGSNDKITFGDTEFDWLDYNVPFTISFWVNPDSVSSTDYFIIDKSDASPEFKGWNVRMNNGQIWLGFDPGAGDRESIETTSSVNANEWTKVDLLYDGNGDLTTGLNFYFNGVLQPTQQTQATGTLTSSVTTNQQMTFGMRDVNSGLPYDGLLSSVWFSDVLKQRIVEQIRYNAEKSDTDMVTVGTEESQ